jgi:hypothetical protein
LLGKDRPHFAQSVAIHRFGDVAVDGARDVRVRMAERLRDFVDRDPLFQHRCDAGCGPNFWGQTLIRVRANAMICCMAAANVSAFARSTGMQMVM